MGLLITSLLVAVIVELLNSGIEAMVDRIGDEPHQLSGRAEDLGSVRLLFPWRLTLVLWFSVAIDRFG